MRYQRSSYRKLILSGLLVILLSVWSDGLFSPHTSQASSSPDSLTVSRGTSKTVKSTASSPGVGEGWGGNPHGQLGDGTTTDRNTPTMVHFPNGVLPVAIAAGANHTMGLGNDGKLYTWGWNYAGQLGDGTTISTSLPKSISLPNGVSAVKIAGGEAHSLAIGSDGNIYAWGYNSNGQLGDGTTTQRLSPVVVSLPAGVSATAITAGLYYSLAIGSDGQLYAWGYNSNGQLGDGTTTDRLTPVVITLPNGAAPVSISAGWLSSLAIGSDGKAYAWGDNSKGQLGDGTTTQRTSPVVVNLPTGVTANSVSTHGYHGMALGSDNKLYAWGDNLVGDLGDGTTTQRNNPVVIILPSGATPVAISCGYAYSLAIGNNGKMYGWGSNLYGLVGDGTNTDRYSPVLVNLPAGSIPLAIEANNYSLAIISPPTLGINNVSKTEGNSGSSPITFTVALSYTTSQTVTVNYATSDGTATAGSDYTATSGTLTFGSGVLTQTISVPVIGDTNIESDETFTVTLSSPTNAAITTSQGIGTIINDDVCSPLLVTAITDDGSGTNCGTLSYALSQPVTGSSPVTVTFALSQGNTITFTGSLTSTAKVKAGVTIFGGVFGSPNRIILNGNGIAGDGLHLAGHNYLVNLTIEHFGGRELVLEGTGNRMQGVVVIAS